MNRKAVALTLFLCLLSLGGCKVGPNYRPPKQNLPDQWSAPKTAFSYEPPPILWWEVFDDPLLNKYIHLAVQYNYDVRKAEANILQTRALRQVAAAPLFPKINADWDAFHIFLSKNGPIDAFLSAQPGSSATPAIPAKLNLFNNFIDATWELDLFGKTRRGIEAAEAQFESSIEQKNEILISVFGEIARNYLELRSSQKQKMLLEKNIDLLQNSTRIIQKRYTTGYSNALDLEQIQVQLNQAIAALPAVNVAIYRSIFSLSVLTGYLPETLLNELLCPEPLPELPECLSIGLRSDLLRRRPDIREAERNLAQATANVGVAVASFFPTFTLAGLMGVESIKLHTLYNAHSKMGLYGGDVNMPIFQGGKLIGNLKVSKAQQIEAALTYQQTVLNALQETETALIAYGEDQQTIEELEKIVQSNQKLAYLNQQRYRKGLTNRLDDLNSQLILNNSELSLLQAQTSALLDLVSLYKALGGGWEPFNLTAKP
jgi:outer membrane protein, multidrug efflux system